jgi:hypothetical protein
VAAGVRGGVDGVRASQLDGWFAAGGGEQLDKRAGADPAGDGEAVGVVAGEPWPEASQGPREDSPPTSKNESCGRTRCCITWSKPVGGEPNHILRPAQTRDEGR